MSGRPDRRFLTPSAPAGKRSPVRRALNRETPAVSHTNDMIRNDVAEARRKLAASLTEAEFQATIIEEAQLKGWRVAHFRPARRQDDSFVTAVAGDGKGWPDLTLVRRNRIIFAELKSERGATSPEQETWLDALQLVAAGNAGVEVFVWRPSDQRRISETLD